MQKVDDRCGQRGGLRLDMRITTVLQRLLSQLILIQVHPIRLHTPHHVLILVHLAWHHLRVHLPEELLVLLLAHA